MKKMIAISVLVILGIGLWYGVDYLYRFAIIPGDKDFLADVNESNNPHVFEDWEFIEEQPEYDFLTARDGLTLRGIHLKHTQPANKIAIVVHGYGNAAKGMFDYAQLFFNEGYDVFMPDARGHGESQGDYIGFGWHERLDLVDWTNYVLAKYDRPVSVALYGLSMGAATVMMTSGETLPEEVKVIIEDCGYDKLSNELAFQLKDMYRLPAFPLIPLTSLYTQLKVGYNFYEVDAMKQLANNHLPTLFIHGTKDTFVPTSMVKNVYQATQGEKELWLVEGAGHAQSIEKDPVGYQKKVHQFLEKYIPTS